MSLFDELSSAAKEQRPRRSSVSDCISAMDQDIYDLTRLAYIKMKVNLHFL